MPVANDRVQVLEWMNTLDKELSQAKRDAKMASLIAIISLLVAVLAVIVAIAVQ